MKITSEDAKCKFARYTRVNGRTDIKACGQLTMWLIRTSGMTLPVCATHRTEFCSYCVGLHVKFTIEASPGRHENGVYCPVSADRVDAIGCQV